MGKVDEAVAAQLRNIEKTTNRSVAEWTNLIGASGLTRHGQVVSWLKAEHGLGHGNANRLAIEALALEQPAPTAESLIDAQYAGATQHLRPICDRVISLANGLGADVEVSPKKTGVSLRRSKQFALIEAPSSTRVRLGLNDRSLIPTGRLKATTGMCTHTLDLTSLDDIDSDVLEWLRAAYSSA